MKLLKELYESAKFIITEPLFKELKDYLKSNNIYIDEFYFENNELFGEITWGDWKHEHHRADWYVKQFFAEHDIEVRHEQWTTDSDGADCYSARHIWRLFSRNDNAESEELIDVKDETVEPVYVKENLTNLSNASATTVEDIIAGMIGNVSDDEIDQSLAIFGRIAITLGVKDYADLQVLVHDGDYDLSQFDTMFSFKSDVYKTKNIKLYIIDERGSDVFKAVQEVYAGGTYFIYAKDVATLDRIVQAVEKYNNSDTEEVLDETTNHQLDNREKTLYNNIRQRLGTTDLAGTREQWTDAEKREYSEIRCISMIHSILAYADSDCTIEYVMKNRYMKSYIDELGEDKVKSLIADEIEEFKKATVRYAGTDSEGVSYNKVIFKESSDSSTYDNMEVYVPGDDIPANWYSKKSYQDFINQDPDKTKDWIDFNMLVNDFIPDEIRSNINDFFNLTSDEWEMLADKYPKQFRHMTKTVTEEMTDLVHDDWEQPDVDIAVFVKGDYQIKKLSDDDADKEEWEVMHFKGDTNEGTSMGKYDNLDAAKKMADDDAKKYEPKLVNENFITEPTVGKLYYFTKNNNIYSGTFRRKTPSWYFFEDENGNEIPVSIFASISDIREELENLLGVVDKLEKDTKIPMTVPNRWTRVPNQHGKPLGESSDAGLKIYAKNIKVGDKFVSTKSALYDYMPHKTFIVTGIEDIGKDELLIRFVSDEGNEFNKIFDVTNVVGFVPNSNLTEDTNSEYEYRKDTYLKAKAEFEKYGEEDNNDVLSREEKMRIAKAEFEKVGGNITEEYDPKDTEFNDKYFPRVDLNDSNIHYYKLDNDEYAYDMKNAVVMFLFKDEDEVEHFGIDKAPYRVLDTAGLSRDNWNDRAERDEYLRGYKQDLDNETSYLVQDFIQNELPMYKKDIK